MAQTKTIGKRYILGEELGSGGMGVVHRAYDRLTGQTVALKWVTTSKRMQHDSTGSSIDLRFSLAQEFKILASLRHPHIISVLDYGFDDEKQPFFTMELLENARTILDSARSGSLSDKVRLMVQMLQALTYLHRRGVIHRDLKPSNVMVIDSTVKVLDFGLSTAKDTDDQLKGSTAGTLAYMAPEVLQGAPASQSADLYAAGVMIYELLTGEHPFAIHDITRLISDILTKPVILDRPEVDDGLGVLLGTLLAKSPDIRPTDANQVIAILCEATQQPIPPETSATRESFLQAAQLVGRHAELTALSEALAQAQAGRGSAWLIAGESGVGKSRLLDELRTLALVQGAMVVRGQGIMEGGGQYLLWRPILRWMCLITDLTAEEASILKTLLPDIGELFGQAVPDAPHEPNPQAAQERLLRVIDSLFQRLTNSPQPLVVILEDLHWASESIELLARLSKLIADLPVVFIGSYRDEEAPNLPDRLPDVPVLKLNRLAPHHIAELSEAMLGKGGRQQQVVDLLQRETEGNVFFLVEVVRALAEEAGRLDLIGQTTLPPQVFAGGVQEIVQRRLSRIPEKHIPLLKKVAVYGRQIDLNLLPILNRGGERLVNWTTACADAAVLDVQDDEWRFAHDKLREGVLANISDEERRTLHRDVARAIEMVYGESPEKAPLLVFHWTNAGDDAKVAQFATIAGDQAMRHGANREAHSYFTRAMEALDRQPHTDEIKRRYIDTAIKVARMGAYLLRDDSLVEMLKRCIEDAVSLNDEVRKTRLLGSIAAYYYVQGRMGEALAYFNQIIEAAERLGLEELLVLPYNIMGRVMIISGVYAPAVPLLLKGIPLAEKYRDIELLSGSWVFLAAAHYSMGNMQAGDEAADQAMQLAEKLGHPSRIASNLVVLAAVYLYWDTETAHDYLRRVMQIAQETQDLQVLYSGSAELAYTLLQMGQLDEAAQRLDFSLNLAERGHIIYNLPTYNAWRAMIEVALGQPEAALKRALAVLPLAEATRQQPQTGEVLRAIALAHSALQNWGEAESALLQAIEVHKQAGAAIQIPMRLFDLAELYAQQGKGNQAQAALDEAISLFAQYQLTGWVARAEALRAGL